ncbi:MAG: hypothetical protein ABII71_01330 [Candidatus Micrarchaeota archaeon]
MKKLLVAFALLLVLLYGCTSSLGFVFEEDCEDMRDSEMISCLHQAAVTMAHLSQASDDSAAICLRIMDDIGTPHAGDDLGRRAETEKNLCLYDVVKNTARYDETAIGWCGNIRQANYQDEFLGSAVTQDMCLNQYSEMRELAAQTEDNEGSLCNMTLSMIMSVLVISIFYRRR